MSNLGQVGKTMYAHGNEVAIVLLTWLGSRLVSTWLVGDDCTSFVALALHNQELHALNNSSDTYHWIFLIRSNQYKTLLFFCEN